MTKQQLRDQITDCMIRSSISSQIDNILETVWGQPFDGITEKITEKIPEKVEAMTQYEMGNACYYINGSREDYEGAMKWWRKAAEQGNYDAMLALVNAYRKGEGVPKDERLADYWLKQSFRATS